MSFNKREQNRGRNAQLCIWLEIPPLATYEGPHGKTHDQQHEYPKLSTQEGFWILRDSLKAKGYLTSVLDLGDEGTEVIIRSHRYGKSDAWARNLDASEALFEAACVLRQQRIHAEPEKAERDAKAQREMRG